MYWKNLSGSTNSNPTANKLIKKKAPLRNKVFMEGNPKNVQPQSPYLDNLKRSSNYV